MTNDPRDLAAGRALDALRSAPPGDPLGRATPPDGLAARAAAFALAQPARSFLDELTASITALVRPAAALACATALVLGAASARTRDDGADSTTARAQSKTLTLMSESDAMAAVLPFAVETQDTASQGGAR